MADNARMLQYFRHFSARLTRLAGAYGLEIKALTMTSGVSAEVLGLAGSVAHTSERKFAPLASFVTGIAVGELRAAGRLGSNREIAALVAQIRNELDVGDDAPKA